MKRWLMAAVLLGVSTSGVEAIDFKNRLSIGGTWAVPDPIWRSEFDKSHEPRHAWGGYASYGLINNLSLVAGYSDLTVQDRDSEKKLRFRPATLSLRVNMAPRWILNPYIRAGGGVSMNEREFINAPNAEWNKIVGVGGAGFEIFVTPSTSLGFEALYHQFVAENGNNDYGVATYGGTLNIYFGKSEKSRENEAALAQARAENERLQREKSEAEARAQQAQQQGQQQLTEAQRQAAEAEARAREVQGRAQQAQAELDNIRQMIASRQASPINFETGKATLLAESYPTLKLVGDSVKKYPDLKLRIEGHTDNVGSDTANLSLSQKRAEAVRSFLVDREGLPQNQITAVGVGETRPIDTNDTPEGRAKNRRVEFIYTL